MEKNDARFEYLRVLNQKNYLIDEIAGHYLNESFVLNDDTSSITDLINRLNSCKSKIILDGAFSPSDLAYFKILLKKSIESYGMVSLNNKEYFLQNNIDVFESRDIEQSPPEDVKVDIRNVKPLYLGYIEEYSRHKFNITNSLISEIDDKLEFVAKPVEASKMKLNLSVAEIALLFRLLNEEKVFKVKHKTEIYRFISEAFSTKIQDSISEASVKNKFLSPDNSALENIETILIRMKQNLRNM